MYKIIADQTLQLMRSLFTVGSEHRGEKSMSYRVDCIPSGIEESQRDFLSS